jgi:VanZ family protein
MTLQRIPLTWFRIALAVALVVTMYLATTRQAFPVIDGVNDKVKHVFAFYVLTLLADYSTPKIRFSLSKGLAILSYGLLIEVVQHFLPYRTFSLFDLAADGIGITAYALSQPVITRLYILRRC